MKRPAELRARREALLARSEGLRQQLAEDGAVLEVSLGRVDRGLNLVRAVRAKPLVLAAGAGLIFALGPRRTLGWISRGIFITSMARRAFGMLAAHRAHKAARVQHQHHPELFL